jgi:hypothetical protein
MLTGAAKGASIAISLTIGILAITVASWGLITYWSSKPVPIMYEIMSVDRNDNTHGCDTPFVTVIKDVTTKSIEFKCGRLGISHEIIPIYKETHEHIR